MLILTQSFKITDSEKASTIIELIEETEKEESSNETTDATVEIESCATGSQDKTDIIQTSKTENTDCADNDVNADTKTEENANMEEDKVETGNDASKTVTVQDNSASETKGSKTGMCIFYLSFCTIYICTTYC